jgi:protein ImuA
MPESKKDIINQLRKDILLLEGFKPPTAGAVSVMGLGLIEAAFPNGIFPTGTVHEFLGMETEQAAACGGFMAALLGKLMRNEGIGVWISTSRKLFPPALKTFGIEPDRVVFVDLQREMDVLWAMEEALKCEGLAAVIGEVREISFAQSRRLQLAVENSRVTGFILRTDARKLNTTACTARWQITALPSEPENKMPGVGFPRWNVELLKVRNGNPGAWQIEWAEGHFIPVSEPALLNELELQPLQVG